MADLPTIAELRVYMHAEDESDDVIAGFLTAALDYLAGAGVPDGSSRPDTYRLCVKSLALHFYDHRSGGEMEPGLRMLIRQLQCAARRPEVGA